MPDHIKQQVFENFGIVLHYVTNVTNVLLMSLILSYIELIWNIICIVLICAFNVCAWFSVMYAFSSAWGTYAISERAFTRGLFRSLACS